MKTLYEATRDLHHACEAHPVGQRMFAGNVTRAEWAYWLTAFQTLHAVIDLGLPDHMNREVLLQADLSVLPLAETSESAVRFAETLKDQDITGSAYVLHGAHRSGGRVLAPTLVKRGLPCGHICYRNPDEAQAWVKSVRGKIQHTQQARDTFACLLAVMDEILSWSGTLSK